MKLILFWLKYTPFVLAALMVLHTALLLRGIDPSILNHACLSPLPYALYMALSVKMKFCRWHRAALTYSLIVYICIVAQGYNVFDYIGIDLALARLVVMCAGVALLSGFLTSRIYERKRGTECCACGNCGSGE